MKNYLTIALTACFFTTTLFAAPLDGQPDYQTDTFGYYYMVTGSQFPNGQTVNGDNASGGTLRFLTDDTYWGHPTGQWVRDDWFPENSGLALTMKNDDQIVYDNNLIENGDPYGPDNFYNDELSTNTNAVAGLYGGYCMSNNFDWIYSGYFKLNESTTVDTVIGYFDGRSGFDPFSSYISYRMNIWSSVAGTGSNAGYLMPADTASFDGDVLCTDTVAGLFSVSDTGVNRRYSGWDPGQEDDIWRVEFQLDSPITLDAGEYFFSHDATVPEPMTLSLLSLGSLALLRRKKM